MGLITKISVVRGTQFSIHHTRSQAAHSALKRSARSMTNKSIYAFSLGDVSKYLSEAASQIFSPMNDTVPWERIAEPFAGSITHHEDVKRLTILREEIKAARVHLESNIEHLPVEAAINTAHQVDKEDTAINTEDFITSSISRVFGHNFKGDHTTEPNSYYGGGYRSRGRTQRETRREIDRLRRFEHVISTAIDTAKVQK